MGWDPEKFSNTFPCTQEKYRELIIFAFLLEVPTPDEELLQRLLNLSESNAARIGRATNTACLSRIQYAVPGILASCS